MNFSFSTESERIAVIEDLRKASINFPPTWDASRTRQQQSMCVIPFERASVPMIASYQLAAAARPG
jgi:hypothetical protein